MKITHWLEVQKEIEIDLSAEDISMLYREAYSEDPKAIQQAMLANINGFASYLKGLPDEIIEDLSVVLKKTISNFLIQQGERFNIKT